MPDNVSHDAKNVDMSRDTTCELGTSDGTGDCNAVNQTVLSAPQAQSALSRGLFVFCNPSVLPQLKFIIFLLITSTELWIYDKHPLFVYFLFIPFPLNNL